MKRRQFIALIGGAAVAWPRAGHAQQAGKLPTIGFLGASSQSGWSSWTSAFVTRLRELGWIEGNTVTIEYRWAEGRKERFAEFAAEFVRLKVDVIVTAASAGYAAKQVTSTIPIVLAVATDPVGDGLVMSLARPGGNITGMSLQQNDIAGKRLGLLREILPSLKRVAILADAGFPADALEMDQVEAMARSFRHRDHQVSTPGGPRYRARHRSSKGRCRRPLRLCRLAYNHKPTTDHHFGAGCAAADDFRCAGERRSGRSDVLWTELFGLVPEGRRICRQNFARGEAIRPAN
jgi:hypothetical protein